MTVIVDYGVGNLFSLQCSLHAIGEESVISGDAAVIASANRILLPGVGAFRDAAEKLRASGLVDMLIGQVQKGVPLLGICLGMQLLFDKSYEYGEYAGLGLIPGAVRPISEVVPAGYKIPHMGWNALDLCGKKHPLLKYISENDYVYFVHSYQAVCADGYVIAKTEYAAPITAAVARENVMGCQFHPEKSGTVGLNILRAFCEMKGGAPC